MMVITMTTLMTMMVRMMVRRFAALNDAAMALSGGAGIQISIFEKQARLGGRLEVPTWPET
eukprot:22065-Eustigmatos_ZCMA.PRE.1